MSLFSTRRVVSVSRIDMDSDSSVDSLLTEGSLKRRYRYFLYASTLLWLADDFDRQQRGPIIDREREHRSAKYFIRLSELEGSFLQEYGVTVLAFRKLTGFLRDQLSPKRHARRSSIDAETKILITLRFLRGGAFWDIIRKHGISRCVFYRYVHQVMDAIDKTDNFGIPKWPTSEAECDVYANEWAKLRRGTLARFLLDKISHRIRRALPQG
jgi:hypothetical protein